MQIGIFASTFARPTLAETLDVMKSNGIEAVQFNLSDAGLPNLPVEGIADDDARRVCELMDASRIRIAALSGTFNMIDPDLEKREHGIRGLLGLIPSTKQFGTNVVTLCTGTRDPVSMWRRHPDNDSPEAWADLVQTLEQLLPLAEAHGVLLAYEPEVSNVIDSAVKGRRLIDELGSPALKVCMDGANVFHAGELPRMREILDEAFDLLGSEIALAHAKDLDHDGEAGHQAAGTGLLDYDHYLRLLHASGYRGAIILHSLSEAQAPGCIAFLKEKLAALPD